jgi:transcriptional regulator with XRE-family HTH domain
MTISTDLKRRTQRLLTKQSLRQVARDSDVDVAILSKWLSGRRGLSDGSVDKLGKFFKLRLVKR